MAEHYDVLSITQETAVVSPTATLAVSRVSFVTKPYGWQAWVNIPVKGATVQSVHTSVEQYALLMNLTAEYEGVVGGYGAQDVDESGLLTDYLVVVVGYESGRPDLPGPYQVEQWFPMVAFGNPYGFASARVRQNIEAAYLHLKGIVEA